MLLGQKISLMLIMSYWQSGNLAKDFICIKDIQLLMRWTK